MSKISIANKSFYWYDYYARIEINKGRQIMIEFRNVNKTYDTGTVAVNNANFKIDKGEFAFLVGSSGSGKSTLIKMI